MQEHELKTWPEYFRAILDGRKRYEIRLNDRDFKVGDVLHLREWKPEQYPYSAPYGYTGREMRVAVTFMTRGPSWSLPENIVVMSIAPDRDRLSAELDESERLNNKLLLDRHEDAQTIDRLAAEVERLTKERDEANGHASSMVVAYNRELSRAQVAEYERDSFSARVRELESAARDHTTLPTDLMDRIVAKAEGRCLGTIGDGFVVCGEGGNYCSEACRLRARVRELELKEEDREALGDLSRWMHGDLAGNGFEAYCAALLVLDRLVKGGR